MLYPKNQTDRLDPALFADPTAEYRGTPFWAWNCELTQELLDQEIDYMKQMGLGGFLMHPRVGLSTRYLGEDYMNLIRGCVEKARGDQMLAWLYDEDKWPSGFAGGLVTKDKKLRRRFLLFTPTPYAVDSGDPDRKPITAEYRNEQGKLLAKYDIVLDTDGCLVSGKQTDGTDVKGRLWYAYLECDAGSPWFNNQGYVDTLSKPAIDRFIEITHEAYKKAVGEEFGGMIPAIFTDEPQFCCKQTLGFADACTDVVLPFTDDLPQTYEAAYGQSLMEHLPELFWELPGGKISIARYRYHDHVAERFAEAFADNVGGWCAANGLALTGHMMNEPSLLSQTSSLGDTMRSYRGFQLPGIDMLCDARELTTAKQCQSAVHQYGREGMLSELYGVTDWDFDFRGHKLQGDWQTALGVSIRAQHLYWVSMGGHAKRDYPACIGHQSPWYREYSFIENHFARVNTVMTRGKPVVKIGVIHPVESYWLHWGPRQQTAGIREELERRFTEITDWLLYGLDDFDFICESLLPQQFGGVKDGFCVGTMRYDAVIVPGCETLRSTTLAALRQFAEAGGTVIFAGDAPRYVDAALSEEGAALAARCTHVGWSRSRILQALEPLRLVEIRRTDGTPSDNLVYQLRCDGAVSHLFLAHVNPPRNADIPEEESYRICLRGEYCVKELDTLTGAVRPLAVTVRGGFTRFDWDCYAHSSLLLELSQADGTAVKTPADGDYLPAGEVAPVVPITLEEPNVLLLDMAQFQLDGGEWQPPEEILRIDTLVRARLGYSGGNIQPWADPQPPRRDHMLRLRYCVKADRAFSGLHLGLESLQYTSIFVNGQPVVSEADGHFVDSAIETVALPALHEGENELVLELRYGVRATVEDTYLLGDFGVEVRGREARLTEPVRSLAFGDITHQGLPFYGGNIVYHCGVAGGRETAVEVTDFRNPVVCVDVDGKRAGVIAIEPYRVALGQLGEGVHRLDITACGNRFNTFGAVHNCDEKLDWRGPNAWRMTGASWSYEYRLKPTGILVTPRLLVK